jgi:hypothetical protein
LAGFQVAAGAGHPQAIIAVDQYTARSAVRQGFYSLANNNTSADFRRSWVGAPLTSIEPACI